MPSGAAEAYCLPTCASRAWGSKCWDTVQGDYCTGTKTGGGCVNTDPDNLDGFLRVSFNSCQLWPTVQRSNGAVCGLA